MLPAAAAKPGKGAPAPAAGSLDTFKFKHTAEDADTLAAELVPENFAAGLSDSNWKTRLATLEEMTGWVESMAESLDSEVLVRFLGKKGWSEKNFQVSPPYPEYHRRAQGRNPIGVCETVRHSEPACGAMSVFREIFGCTMHTAPRGEARRYEAEETRW